MSELHEQVVARLLAAQSARDNAPLRVPAATEDALSLLREAAPSPGSPVDLDKVLAVFWTYWLRHEGPDDPEAAANALVLGATFGFLRPRVPEQVEFPPPLVDAFDPADPFHDARFAHLVGAAHGDLLEAPDVTESDRLAALERALAWSTLARGLLPQGPDTDIQLTVQALGFELSRFALTADPDALAAAALHGRVASEALSSVDPGDLDAVGTDVATLALGTVLDAARMLGDPPLAEVDRLIAAAPAGTLPPEALEALRIVRALQANSTSWPGQFELRIGLVLAEAGIQEHDAGRIACAVRRLRAALAATPAGHPTHPVITAALEEALEALARERGAGASAADTTDPGEASDPDGASAVVDRLRTLYSNLDVPPDIELEVLALATSLTDITVTDEQVDRFRTALAAVPPGEPRRYAYVAVLASLAGTRAAELRASDPAGAARLDAEARALGTEAVAAAPAPAGVPLAGLLAEGRYDIALPLAVVTAAAGDPDGGFDSPELARMVSLLTRFGSLRLDVDGPRDLDHEITVLREILADLPEDETLLRAHVSATLGAALSARTAAPHDLGTFDEIVALLRYARAHAPEDAGATDELLARALTFLSTLRLDPEAAREAAAVLAEAAVGPEAPYPTSGADQVFLSAHIELHSALQNYVLGHDPGQLARAREAALRLGELGRLATDPDERESAALLGFDVMGDDYLNLIDSIGPGGGPKAVITDELIERCRTTFAACPPGHPRRLSTGMTLVNVLTQRALKVRTDDPEQARHLTDEAAQVIDAVLPEAPEGWVDLLRIPLSLAAGTIRLPLPAAVDADGPGHPGPEDEDPVEAVARRVLGNMLGGGATPPHAGLFTVPAWMRAHHEIGTAAGALRQSGPGIATALAHVEAAVELLPRVTDRGSSQEAAENGLASFDGDLRGITELVLMAITVRDVRARLAAFGVDAGASAGASAGAGAGAEDGSAGGPGSGGEAGPGAAPGTGGPTPSPGRATAFHPSGIGIVDGPDVERAVELLERGRGLLLSRRIEARADLGDLRAAHPGPAGEFERLTGLLADLTTTGPEAGPATRPAEAGPRRAPDVVPERARLDGLHASRDLDELIGHIRTLPGFDAFLRPLTGGRLRELAVDGPVVVLLQGPHYLHALVVTGRTITALPLAPPTDELTDTAHRLREAVGAISLRGSARPSPADLVGAGATTRRALSWTWHRIVRPVLAHLGADGPVPDSGAWPRIWWIPTGAFHALPLHAAQCTLPDCDEHGCGSALDTVVSSYVPGFQTLAYARSRAAHREGGGPGAGGTAALLVAAPENEMPGVAEAARYAAGLLRAPAPLVGTAATREAVLGALGGTQWVHFGCHAATDPAEPSGARLHLPSGEQLSVLEICRARPHAARLAFLTACGTARTSERLSDEAIHITSAFLLAGFPAAVGTLWEIDSAHADHVTRDFYRRVTADDTPGSALALHHTVRELRRRIPDRPHIWAAYVHAGA
ncbi:CHAT domain-containing protein [Kitasatospora sp. NPDC002965]|uniref:CHAT domain-containing protein n=1 Tax=Kitasatospora sp. NPDC002965 TaxID=3154775 RepID=UPI0033B87A4B